MAQLQTRRSTSHHIVEELRRRVRSGRWKPSQRITSEHALSREFGVCRATVTKSLKELEREGLLVSRVGVGRFVAVPQDRKRTWTVGIVISDLDQLTHPVPAGIVQGANRVIGDSNYHIKIYAINFRSQAMSPDDVAVWEQLIDPDRLDGMLVATREMPNRLIQQFAEVVPIVRLMDAVPDVDHALRIAYDLVGGAYDAVQHLVELGHRHIGFVTIGPNTTQGHEQTSGARLAVRDSQADLAVAFAERNRAPHAEDVVDQMLHKNPRITAIACGSDELALGVWHALKRRGLTVPRDASLVGWNDTLSLEQIPVTMTTIVMDQGKACEAGMRALLRMIDRPTENIDPFILDTNLIVRDSTATPPHASLEHRTGEES